jgi:hypothetical protein
LGKIRVEDGDFKIRRLLFQETHEALDNRRLALCHSDGKTVDLYIAAKSIIVYFSVMRHDGCCWSLVAKKVEIGPKTRDWFMIQ